MAIAFALREVAALAALAVPRRLAAASGSRTRNQASRPVASVRSLCWRSLDL